MFSSSAVWFWRSDLDSKIVLDIFSSNTIIQLYFYQYFVLHTKAGWRCSLSSFLFLLLYIVPVLWPLALDFLGSWPLPPRGPDHAERIFCRGTRRPGRGAQLEEADLQNYRSLRRAHSGLFQDAGLSASVRVELWQQQDSFVVAPYRLNGFF